VTDLINDIANDLRLQLTPSNKIFKTYSAEIDKITDVEAKAQLTACINFHNWSFCITEELGINFYA
jgi:hypothetical protein